MAEPQQELTDIYITVPDKTGNTITIFSSNGELKSTADFGKALKQYNTTNSPGAGFVVLPQGGMQESVRRGFENTVGDVARNTLPSVGESVGGAIPNKLLELGVKAGLVTPQTQASATQAGATGGRAVGKFIGEQFDTPGEAGMAVGTGIASKALAGALPIVGASGELLKGNLLGGMLGTGALGATGAAVGRAVTGEDQSFSQTAQEFTTAALSKGLQGVASYWLTRMLKPDTATKVATEMMDTIKNKYPTLINDPNAFDIANSSPKDISNLTSMMSKALRGDAADESEMLLGGLKEAIPYKLSVGKQNTLRMHNRRIIEAQTAALDNIGDKEAFNEALPLIKQRKEELVQAVREMYPKVKNIDPALVKVEQVLSKHSDYVDTFREGATVLHHLKESGAAEKFDPMEFAQRIRGDYTKDPGSLLNKVGKILGQGDSLKTLPLRSETPTPTPQQDIGSLIAQGVKGFVKGLIPHYGTMEKSLRSNSMPTPWSAPPIQGLAKPGPSFGAQEAGQAAMKAFLSKREQPEGSVDVRINP